jgi:hypothetical protein
MNWRSTTQYYKIILKNNTVKNLRNHNKPINLRIIVNNKKTNHNIEQKYTYIYFIQDNHRSSYTEGNSSTYIEKIHKNNSFQKN